MSKMMADVCVDNRFELIAKYKAKLIEATNIETDKAEMDVIDNVLFRIWQMGWLDRLEQSEPLERRRGMDDLIDRQASIDAIENCEPGEEVFVIKSLPSAQPEIIRCKDCKWYGRVDKRRFYRGMDCMQKRIDTILPDRDFCSRAERRTNE